ncbi:MAG: Leucine--tRNA ligase [Chlamydiia bacterium]|nr:Leucine--tRNA ligase [Chlamydiia bacterium]MCH9615590.1 Leucine--tRNA ligase [Chlamydiia bacterium]MCH9629245.1 Leucine--tRNA ligase [Chlamydiia bacterium]
MYQHKEIEKKWQNFWDKRKLFAASEDQSKPKYYILDMFPYPSGAGLHVGHVTGYTATDILARYKRMKGFNVLHPMGWDSFGLPAEQYAVRTGTHPQITTEKNINTYREQLKSLGFSYDWDREFATSDASYYKWTQWVFTELFKKGLAYEAEINVNYCPHLGTVLANEEVEDGKSKEGGYPIERRPLKQWVLKITEYAERLLNDLDDLDWPDHLKTIQRNWIGRSEGASMTFGEIEVFTTKPATYESATFVVLAPEHPLVDKLATDKETVAKYRKEVECKSDLERTDLAKNKTGVPIGATVKHPKTGMELPIWIADYVLVNYGTGAVMAVPEDDERDMEFAEKYNLPIIPLTGSTADEMCDWIEENNVGKRTVTYKLRDWLFSRQRYWGEPFPILHFEDGTMRPLELDELPLEPPQLTDYKPPGDGQSALAKVKEWVEITDAKTGKKALRETNTMPQWAGSCWYYLRFIDPHNKEAAWNKDLEKYWLPVDMYVGGVEHAVLHLLYARFWHKVLYDLGHVVSKEPFQTLRNQGLVTAKSYKLPGGGYIDPQEAKGRDDLKVQVEKMSKSKLNGVRPDELIEEVGADSIRLYEMFMGPFDKEKLWNSEAVSGCRRMLKRFYDMVFSDKVTDASSPEALKLGHRLVHGVGQDIENMQFNTAIAKLMEFLNAFVPMESYPKEVLKMATLALAPLAPHLAEECFEHLGHTESLMYEPFPVADPKYLVDDVATYIVQVNGKMRGKFEMPKDKSQDELLEIIKQDERVAKYLTGEIKKVIYVPNKLLNLVVK